MGGRRTFFAALILLCAWSRAEAACAPPPPVNDQAKKVDTEGALGRFMKVVGVNLHVNFSAEKKQIFSAYPNADQIVVILTTIYNVCSMLESSTQLSDQQKIQTLVTFQSEILARAIGPRPIASTAAHTRTTAPPSPQDQLRDDNRSQREIRKSYVRLVAARAADWAPIPIRNITWADIYLNPVPFFITDKNKYFVIVGSALDEAEARQKMFAMKARFPEYDFELYAPYGANPYYGIMIASWVSRERAAEALVAAKKIDRTSFLWACRGSGEQC